MTSTYSVQVQALNADDAADIAKRRARDDGWTVVTVRRVHAIGVPAVTIRMFAVELAVRPRG